MEPRSSDAPHEGAAYVGIDLGTSAVKVVAVDARGDVLADASHPYELSTPAADWREIDPVVWWDQTCAALGDVLRALPQGTAVAAVGVTGQMHTVVPLGADGRAVRPALMWNDMRTAAIVGELRGALREAGEPYLANLVSTGSPAANLVWLKRNEPAAFDAMERFVIGPDWIVLKLTGVVGTDFCEASTSSLFDVEHACWSKAAQAACGLPAKIFPEVRGAAEVAGAVLERAAAETGLPAGVPVLVGTGDNPASAIPTGCLTEGVPTLSLGTSCVLMARRSSPNIRARGKNILVSLDGREISCLVQGVVQSSGPTRDWLVRDLFASEFEQLDAAVDLARSGAGGLMFFPHMAGEKTLYGDPSLRGALFGLSTDTTRADIDLAVMEGIAYGVRQLAEALAVPLGTDSPLRVVGGGARSDVWMQVIADVLGCPLCRLDGSSGAGYGIALLAASVATGSLPRARTEGGESWFVPDPAAAARHNRVYRKYLCLHDAIVALREI